MAYRFVLCSSNAIVNILFALCISRFCLFAKLGPPRFKSANWTLFSEALLRNLVRVESKESKLVYAISN